MEYSGTSQTSKMERLTEIANGFANRSILYGWQGSKYTYATRPGMYFRKWIFLQKGFQKLFSFQSQKFMVTDII